MSSENFDVISSMNAVVSTSHVAIVDLADELQVQKSWLFKILKKHRIETGRRRESERGNQMVATISAADAETIRSEVRDSKRQLEAPREQTGDVEGDNPFDGVFYMLQLEPEHDPGRFKVGFTTDPDGRLRKHRCSAPYARVLKSWPCRPIWERTAIECATHGLEQIHTEVFRAESIDGVIERGNRFFAVMPRVELLAE